MPPKKKKRKIASGVDIGTHGEQGERDYNEDVFCTCTWKKLKKGASVSPSAGAPVHFFGMYDGHGGAECSKFAAKRFPKELKIDLEAGLPPMKAMVNANYATEVAFFREHPGDESGTTAVCMLYDSASRSITVSNVGDSRALLVRKSGKIVPLTTDQDGANSLEVRRIKAAGGFVDAEGYVNGDVQTARSIGDVTAKFMDGEFSAAVVPTPAMLQKDLAETDIALVLACDGLFEAHGGSNAWINVMVRSLVKEGKNAKQIAQALVKQALDDGSEDNTSAIVVLL